MRHTRFALIVLVLVAAAPATSRAQTSGGNAPYIDISGFYAFDGYTQNNFFLGKNAVGGVSDKDDYAIQLFRLTTEFGRGENIKVVVRTDLAQGIWGIDNNLNERDLRGGFSNLFNRKDTNFQVHLDWAYLDFTHPDWSTNFKVGRMKYALGNLLVLDQDSDGVQVTGLFDGNRLTVGWAKMSEGADSLSDEAAIGPGGQSTEDATLYLASYTHEASDWTINPYLAYYRDGGYADGTAYLPDGLQYFKPRFSPQITDATVVGLALDGRLSGWTIRAEVDILTGHDKIDNANSRATQLLDVNDGTLDGYNLYADLRTPLGPGTLGFVLGRGSGDDDPMSGSGNINKIRTNGFFYVSEIWEDSIMPDEEGITPQGLGSPASRAYREFENSTLAQANYTWNIDEHFTYYVSGLWVQATEALHPWSDGNGNGGIDPGEFGPEASRDLGSELDMRVTWALYPGLTWDFRGGVFWPGDASGYLINGTGVYDSTAWELRTTIRFAFGSIRIGG
jgi:hypothetical protein